jgi:predicted  nucleic acid-binding Zn-ribbon protein
VRRRFHQSITRVDDDALPSCVGEIVPSCVHSGTVMQFAAREADRVHTRCDVSTDKHACLRVPVTLSTTMSEPPRYSQLEPPVASSASEDAMVVSDSVAPDSQPPSWSQTVAADSHANLVSAHNTLLRENIELKSALDDSRVAAVQADAVADALAADANTEEAAAEAARVDLAQLQTDYAALQSDKEQLRLDADAAQRIVVEMRTALEASRAEVMELQREVAKQKQSAIDAHLALQQNGELCRVLIERSETDMSRFMKRVNKKANAAAAVLRRDVDATVADLDERAREAESALDAAQTRIQRLRASNGALNQRACNAERTVKRVKRSLEETVESMEETNDSD